MEDSEEFAEKVQKSDLVVADATLAAECSHPLPLGGARFSVVPDSGRANRNFRSRNRLESLGCGNRMLTSWARFPLICCFPPLRKWQSGERFGLSYYLSGVGREHTTRIKNFPSKVSALDEVSQFVQGLGVAGASARYQEYANRTRMLADELILIAHSLGSEEPMFRWSFDGAWAWGCLSPSAPLEFDIPIWCTVCCKRAKKEGRACWTQLFFAMYSNGDNISLSIPMLVPERKSLVSSIFFGACETKKAPKKAYTSSSRVSP